MPMDFKLGTTADPNICCTLYILATSITVADRIAEYQLEQIRVFRQTLRKQERYLEERKLNESMSHGSFASQRHLSVVASEFVQEVTRSNFVATNSTSIQSHPSDKINNFPALAMSLHGVKHAFESSPYKEFLVRQCHLNVDNKIDVNIL